MEIKSQPRSRLLGLGGFLSAGLLSLFIIVLKRPDAFFSPQFYAEDGSLFFADAYNLGLRSLFQPYAGYLHLFPRLWALLFLKLRMKPLYAPLFFNLGWLAAFFWVQFYCWLRLPYENAVKWILCVSAVLAPLSAILLMNLTLSPWIFGLSLLPALFSRPPRNKKEAWLDGAAVLIAGLTGPFLVLLFPVYLFLKPDPRTRKLMIALVAALHAFVLISSVSSRQIAGMAASAFSLQKLGYALYMQRAFLLLNPAALTAPVVLKLLIFLLLIAAEFFLVFICLNDFKTNPFRFFCWLSGAVVLSATLFIFRKYLPVTYPSVAARYSFVPAVSWIWAVLAEAAPKRPYFIFAFFLLSYFFLESFAAVEPVRLKDKDWKFYASEIEHLPRAAHQIPINPEGWSISLMPRD